MSPCAPTRFLVPRPRLKGEPVPAIFRRLVVPVLNSSMAHTPRNDESCLLCRGSRHPSAGRQGGRNLSSRPQMYPEGGAACTSSPDCPAAPVRTDRAGTCNALADGGRPGKPCRPGLLPRSSFPGGTRATIQGHPDTWTVLLGGGEGCCEHPTVCKGEPPQCRTVQTPVPIVPRWGTPAWGAQPSAKPPSG